MNVRKFIAQTARDGLHKVKEVLGDDAIILSNRSIPGGVEIMAVAAEEMELMASAPSTKTVRSETSPKASAKPATTRAPEIAPESTIKETTKEATKEATKEGRENAITHVAPTEKAPALRPSVERAREATALLNEEFVAQVTRSARGSTQNPAPSSLEKALNSSGLSISQNTLPEDLPHLSALEDKTPTKTAEKTAEIPAKNPITSASTKEMPSADILEELRFLRKIVEEHITVNTWNENFRNEPVKAEVLRSMLDSGFSPRYSRDVLAQLPKEFDKAQAFNWVKRRTDRAFLTSDAATDIVDQGGVYALVGPTGVGKTTTTAKLAARCVLRHGASKVALITTDGYRIGAHEQLRIYGRILGIPVQLAKTEAELKQLLLDLSHKHMVIIDTMGMSQKDALVAEEMQMFENCAVKRVLVLSATGRGDTLEDVVKAYGGNQLFGCILSKVDEAASLATALDVVLRHGFRLQFVSNGQRVPEDLHLPNRTYLMHRAFKGFTEESPHSIESNETSLLMVNAANSLFTEEKKEND